MTPSVYVALLRDNKVLLIRRRNSGYMDGWFTLPSGYVDDGDRLAVAAAKSLKTEVGVSVPERDLSMMHVMRCYEPGSDKIDFYFECLLWSGFVGIQDTDKFDEMIWADFKKFPHNIMPNVYGFLRHCYSKRFRYFSEIGWGKDRIIWNRHENDPV